MSTDPVEGGIPNNYAYALDPVNSHDLSGEFVQVIAMAFYIAGIASAWYTFHNNPTKENVFWLMLSVIPGGGLVSSGPKVLQVGPKQWVGITITAFIIGCTLLLALVSLVRGYRDHLTLRALAMEGSIANWVSNWLRF